MPKNDYAAILAEVNQKLGERNGTEAGKPIYRLRVIFSDTSSLEEVVEREAEEAKQDNRDHGYLSTIPS